MKTNKYLVKFKYNNSECSFYCDAEPTDNTIKLSNINNFNVKNKDILFEWYRETSEGVTHKPSNPKKRHCINR